MNDKIHLLMTIATLALAPACAMEADEPPEEIEVLASPAVTAGPVPGPGPGDAVGTFEDLDFEVQHAHVPQSACPAMGNCDGCHALSPDQGQLEPTR